MLFRSITTQTERQQQDVDIIERTLRGRRELGGIMDDVVRLTPEQVLLQYVGFERGRGEVAVRGNAPTFRDVLDYVHLLQDSDRYDRVDVRYSTRRNTPAGPRTEFEVAAKLKPAPS